MRSPRAFVWIRHRHYAANTVNGIPGVEVDWFVY